ncbi:hypothetical protein [Pseudofrankia asymbiotica]|uniref:Lipoprotein LpqB beta-propeller domain-containing protein n=1 Tax=Pseudofrankia asymbiotica TaxID=1834516 RepID=A0A1V2I0K4_9ACTN|nr:hypothetical protein [Pseudofrankia asymbiotica]ONH22980.1 hypothetical protein BL253_34235 [Pseudofrankia asymbiotica]
MRSTTRRAIPAGRRHGRRRWLARACPRPALAMALAAALATTGVAACSGADQQPSPPPPTAATAGRAQATAGVPARPDTLVAVTTQGALVVLDPRTGHAIRTLRQDGVVGDAVALTPDGRTVYYEVGTGCEHEIWRVGIDGGAPTKVASKGSVPALNRDGTRLAYAVQYVWSTTAGDCLPPSGNVAATFQVVVLDLATRKTWQYPMPPKVAESGLPAPVGHLSWAPDGARLAVSITAVQDNEGWQLSLMNPSTDTTYFREDGSTNVPLAGVDRYTYYYPEAVFLPNGHLFAVRQCCAGYPPKTTSVDVAEFDPANGRQIRQIAVGLTDRGHTSLSVSADGHWLLYLSGADLQVSQDGARPTTLASGFQAAAW